MALALRCRPERDDDLAEDVELDRRDLVVARELQLRVEDRRLAEVVRARVERRADADAEQLPAGLGVAPPLLDPLVADQLERLVEAGRVVAGVVDAAVGRLVGHLVGADVVALADLDRVDPELAPDDVDHALREPEVLHPRVAAVRAARRLVRADLREVDPDVPPAVDARRDLRPDDAAERLVAGPRTAVVEHPCAEAEHRPVRLDRHLDVEEHALVAVRVRRVLVGAPLGPLHGALQLPREQAERDQLDVRADLVAEPAADVLRDEAELVDPDPQGRRHHDLGEARELVVRVDRPLRGAAVVLDDRAAGLERRGGEAVEVQALDPHDLVRLGERRVVVAVVELARPDHVRADVLVQERRRRVGRPLGVEHRLERFVVHLHEVGGVARELARRRGHGDDRLADVPNAADGEREVLDVATGGRRDLEERVAYRGDLLADQGPVDTLELDGFRHVDPRDRRVCVRRPHEVHVRHAVPLDVVHEDALALDQALVFLPRHVLPDEAGLDLLLLDRERLLG